MDKKQRWKVVIHTVDGMIKSITPIKIDIQQSSFKNPLHCSDKNFVIPSDNGKYITVYCTTEDDGVQAINLAQELYYGYLEGVY